jgi:hypothetical protein
MSKKLPGVSVTVIPKVMGIKIKSPLRKARLSILIKNIDTSGLFVNKI